MTKSVLILNGATDIEIVAEKVYNENTLKAIGFTTGSDKYKGEKICLFLKITVMRKWYITDLATAD